MKEYYLINTIVVQKDCIANLDDLTPCPCDEGETYRHGLTGFLLADGSGMGCVMAVAFATNLQDALDIAADAELLELIRRDDEEAYFDNDLASLGNTGDRYDLQNLVAIKFDVTQGMEQYLSHD